MSFRKTRSSLAPCRGFTAIEMLMTVGIITVVLGIALPNFAKAREGGRTRNCVTNLKTIETAKYQWALDTRSGSGASPCLECDLVGSGKFIPSQPVCLSRGVYYANAVTSAPTCSKGGTHVLPTQTTSN